MDMHVGLSQLRKRHMLAMRCAFLCEEIQHGYPCWGFAVEEVQHGYACQGVGGGASAWERGISVGRRGGRGMMS